MKELVTGRITTWTGQGTLGMRLRSYAYRTEGEVVWIDPVTPQSQDREALEAFGKPDHLIITTGVHDRDVLDIREHYGCSLWVPAARGGDRFIPYPDHRYTESSELPAGLRAVYCQGHQEDEHALIGTVEGKPVAFVGDCLIRIPKAGWLVNLGLLAQPKGEFQHLGRVFTIIKGFDQLKVAQGAKCLLPLNVEMIFPTHGSPLIEDAGTRLAESVSAW